MEEISFTPPVLNPPAVPDTKLKVKGGCCGALKSIPPTIKLAHGSCTAKVWNGKGENTLGCVNSGPAFVAIMALFNVDENPLFRLVNLTAKGNSLLIPINCSVPDGSKVNVALVF